MNSLAKLIRKVNFSFVPLITLTFSIITCCLPYNFCLSTLIISPINYAILFFWTLNKPASVPAILVFFLGIFKDILEGEIIGLNSFYFLCFQVIIFSQRKLLNKSNSFLIAWAEYLFCYALVLTIPFILKLLNGSVEHSSFTLTFFIWLSSCFIYIPLHWLLSLASRVKL